MNDPPVAPSMAELEQSLTAVKHSLSIVEDVLHREREAMHHDRFGRRAFEMPPALRDLYQASAWKSHDVYLWPTVLALSTAGHQRAAAAQAAVNRLASAPDALGASDACGGLENNAALIAEAAATAARLSQRVKTVVMARRVERVRAIRELSREYMRKRAKWVRMLDTMEEAKSEVERESALQQDRKLLTATRAVSGLGGGMTNREIDLIFSEIEAAGGTAGGLERWGRSITGLPNHNPNYLPPAGDGGGVLVENPLAEHYAARSINPWTKRERFLFLEKFVLLGKNFRKIASFFEHKSVEDCVRFYFDNKMRLGLKQLTKDAALRKRGAKKIALEELSRMPEESRSIKDNFIHFETSSSSDSDAVRERENAKAEKFSAGTLGRTWTPSDRQALIFALCRFDVSGDDESRPTTTVWASIAVAVGSKTPRQCRQFYHEYKSILGLESYSPPGRLKQPPTLPPPVAKQNPEDPAPRKVMRRSNSVVKSNTRSVPTAVGDYGGFYANGVAAVRRIT